MSMITSIFSFVMTQPVVTRMRPVSFFQIYLLVDHSKMLVFKALQKVFSALNEVHQFLSSLTQSGLTSQPSKSNTVNMVKTY